MNKLEMWWSEYFEYFVVVDRYRVGIRWPSNTFETSAWLKDLFPHLKGDTELSRYSSDNTPFYHYDWGFTRMMADDVVYYFKDLKTAQLFRLAWGQP